MLSELPPVILFYCGKLDMRPDFVRVGASC